MLRSFRNGKEVQEHPSAYHKAKLLDFELRVKRTKDQVNEIEEWLSATENHRNATSTDAIQNIVKNQLNSFVAVSSKVADCHQQSKRLVEMFIEQGRRRDPNKDYHQQFDKAAKKRGALVHFYPYVHQLIFVSCRARKEEDGAYPALS